MNSGNDTKHGFTRMVYDDGYKYIMVYPPGWKYGDPRQPEVYQEPCVPGPSNPRIAESKSFFQPPPYGSPEGEAQHDA